jgi:hypothetical protein
MSEQGTTKDQLAKLVADTGGGCSVCGATPCVNVTGTYWLCGPCVRDDQTGKVSRSTLITLSRRLTANCGPCCECDVCTEVRSALESENIDLEGESDEAG